MGGAQPATAPAGPEASGDKPFDEEPFNAGVEADENTDPKKFIEQLTGKLGQSLRKYSQSQGQPDVALEKFAINSLLSATHTSTMAPEDQNEIIKKIKTAGNDGGGEGGAQPAGEEPAQDGAEPAAGEEDLDFGGGAEEPAEEVSESTDNGMMLARPKKLSIFAPEGSPEAEYNKGLSESVKKSIFDKNYLKKRLAETFNQDSMQNDTQADPAVAPAQPVTQPSTQPTTQPTQPSRRNKPFLPMPNTQPDPKASK